MELSHITRLTALLRGCNREGSSPRMIAVLPDSGVGDSESVLGPPPLAPEWKGGDWCGMRGAIMDCQHQYVPQSRHDMGAYLIVY
jgi:hypothetical protein